MPIWLVFLTLFFFCHETLRSLLVTFDSQSSWQSLLCRHITIGNNKSSTISISIICEIWGNILCHYVDVERHEGEQDLTIYILDGRDTTSNPTSFYDNFDFHFTSARVPLPVCPARDGLLLDLRSHPHSCHILDPDICSSIAWDYAHQRCLYCLYEGYEFYAYWWVIQELLVSYSTEFCNRGPIAGSAPLLISTPHAEYYRMHV